MPALVLTTTTVSRLAVEDTSTASRGDSSESSSSATDYLRSSSDPGRWESASWSGVYGRNEKASKAAP